MDLFTIGDNLQKKILVREVTIYIYTDRLHFKMLDRDRYIYKKVITCDICTKDPQRE